jgi:hypothetical protein
MFELQKQALQSNTSLLQLVQDIHSLLRPVTSAPKPSSSFTMKASTDHHQTFQTNHVNLTMASSSGAPHNSIQTMSPYYRPAALMAASEVPTPYNDITIPVRPLVLSKEIPSTGSTASSYASFKSKLTRELPAEILKMNVRRQSSGLKAFQAYKEKRFPPKATFKPSFLALEMTTITQLCAGLNYLFRSFAQTRARQASLDRDDRKNEMVRWTQKLEHSLNSLTSESTPSPTLSKEAIHANRNEMVDLLVGLNASIEKSDDKMRRLFYQGTEQAEIDRVLHKLQTVSKSVRAMKEVEEFKDAREEWKDGQKDG